MTKLGDIKIAFKYRGIERQKTYITVTDPAGEVLIVTSVKRCTEDPYDKLLGRFQAFKKAMYQLAIENLITREQRVSAWKSYKEMVKVPSKINLELEKRRKAVA